MADDDLKSAARTATETIAGVVKETGRETLDAARQRLASAAGDAKAALAGEAQARAEAGKDRIAEEGERLAQGLRDAAARQRHASLQGRLLESIADSLSDASEGLRDRSLASLIDDMDRFARRNPGAFVAGAALLGFAAARFGRSSAQDRTGPAPQSGETLP